MVAPYWNTAPQSGDVCEGSMPRPEQTDLSSLLLWEEGFFNSRFTHPSGLGKLTTHQGGFIGLWTELVGKQEFPVHYLARSTQTIEEFMEPPCCISLETRIQSEPCVSSAVAERALP
jgi:PRTRC genetic system protein B